MQSGSQCLNPLTFVTLCLVSSLDISDSRKLVSVMLFPHSYSSREPVSDFEMSPPHSASIHFDQHCVNSESVMSETTTVAE